MNASAAQSPDDLLAVLAQIHGLEGQFGVDVDEAQDVANGRIGIETEKQIRAG